jgi:hypothetical protein
LLALPPELRWHCRIRLLLDPRRGGYRRLGPVSLGEGRQSYLERSNVLLTRWHCSDCELELTDTTLLPQTSRPVQDERRRVLLRRLRYRSGSAQCIMELFPRDNFTPGPVIAPVPGGLELGLAGHSRPVEPAKGGAVTGFDLSSGEENSLRCPG